MMKRNPYAVLKGFCFGLLGLLISLTASNSWAYSSEDCIHCHEEGGKESARVISTEQYEASVHGRGDISCQDCHSGVEDESHQDRRGSGRVNCGECHDQVNNHGMQSKSDNRPQCHSCHTSHAILEKDNPASAVHPDRLKESCSVCHPLECGDVDYMSFLPSLQIASHGKQDFSQAYERTNCIGCHQGMAAHGEEEKLDDQTCYKCHLPGAEQAGLWGYVHPRADVEKQPDTHMAANVYQIALMVLLLGGFGFFVKRFSGRK